MKKKNALKKQTIRDYMYEEPGPVTRRNIRIATVISLVLLVLLVWFVFRLFYASGQLNGKYWRFFTRFTTWKFILEGLLGTLEAALAAFAVAFTAGYLMMRGRISNNRILSTVCGALIEFTRGVPTLLLIYFFLLVVPQMGIKLPALWRIALPAAISAAGTSAEIFRSGVQSVPKGQWEAAYSLGMRYGKAFRKIIFPQAFRYIIPSLIANLVIVVKDTTFAYIVNFPDLMQNAKVLISNYDALLSVYLVTAVLYILINYLLNRLSLVLTREKAGSTNISEI